MVWIEDGEFRKSAMAGWISDRSAFGFGVCPSVRGAERILMGCTERAAGTVGLG